MNVIVANKYSDMLASLEIDVIKSINGEYDVQDIINMFKNIYFQRMILDITAIKDYHDPKIIQKVSMELDTDKIILLLDSDDSTLNNSYLSKIISMGIYNFTSTKEGITYLLNAPNIYKDVAHFQELDPLGNAKIPVYGSSEAPTAIYSAKIIGFKNVTEHAGSTTLIYMILKELQKYRNVVAVEYNKKDFQFFNNNKMESTTKDNFSAVMLNNRDRDVVLVDLNDCPSKNVCTEILYLVEPSIIKISKLLARKRFALQELKGKKVVLNQSFINNDKDVKQFAYEANVEVFANIPTLDDRATESDFINNFLQNTDIFNKN